MKTLVTLRQAIAAADIGMIWAGRQPEGGWVKSAERLAWACMRLHQSSLAEDISKWASEARKAVRSGQEWMGRDFNQFYELWCCTRDARDLLTHATAGNRAPLWRETLRAFPAVGSLVCCEEIFDDACVARMQQARAAGVIEGDESAHDLFAADELALRRSTPVGGLVGFATAATAQPEE